AGLVGGAATVLEIDACFIYASDPSAIGYGAAGTREINAGGTVEHRAGLGSNIPRRACSPHDGAVAADIDIGAQPERDGVVGGAEVVGVGLNRIDDRLRIGRRRERDTERERHGRGRQYEVRDAAQPPAASMPAMGVAIVTSK